MATILLLSLALTQAAWVHLYREGVNPYVAKVTIGVETFSMQVSTTSSLSIVTSTECSNCLSSGYRKTYSTNQESYHSLSPTAEECFSKTVTVTKECGFTFHDHSNYTATGALSTETFKFAGVEIADTVFGRVFQEQNYVKKGIDGVLGFGPGDLLLTYGLSIEERVLKQQSLKDVFSLCHDEDEGLLYIGEINPKLNKKALVSFPISNFARYSLPLTSVSVGFNNENLLSAHTDAVIDSTYRYVGLPEAVIARMIGEFRKYYGESCTLSTCSENRNILKGFPIARPAKGFPVLTLTLGAVNLTFHDYIFPCESNSQLYCSMVIQGPYTHQAVLGNVALSHLELVIDREHATVLYFLCRVGEKQGNCKPPQDVINLWDQSWVSSRVLMLLLAAIMSLVLTLASLW